MADLGNPVAPIIKGSTIISDSIIRALLTFITQNTCGVMIRKFSILRTIIFSMKMENIRLGREPISMTSLQKKPLDS